MRNINGAANQLLMKWRTLHRCDNITKKKHYDDKEFYKILNRYTKLDYSDL